jgi:hypothetical protein
MDQRFSVFFLEKSRLALQRGARSFDEEETMNEKVLRPNPLGQLLSYIVTMASSKMLKKEESILMEPKGIINQSYIE